MQLNQIAGDRRKKETMLTNASVRQSEDCCISICLDTVAGIFITSAEHIRINSQQVHKAGGWTMKDIIECAAFRINAEGGRPYGSWHDVLWVEGFEQTAENVFEVRFGS
jgi:hypothetical protein